MQRRRALLLATFVAFGPLVACEPEPTVGPGGSYPNIPYTVLTASEQSAYDTKVTQLVGDGQTAGLINQFWANSWPQLVPGQLYADPEGITAYEGGPASSACGPLSVENAWYCSTDSSIYYDDNYLRALFKYYGAGAPALLLAHEWGHHIQGQLGQPTVSIRSELQADCYAGMFFGAGVAADVIDTTDVASAGVGVLLIADANYRATEWFKPLVHGPASWRAKAFIDGMLGELAYCQDYENWTERGTEQVGSYRWLPAPAMQLERRDDGVLVASLRDRTAFLHQLTQPPAGTSAMAHMPQAFREWLGENIQAVGAAVEIPTGPGGGGSIGGTAAAQGYQYADTAGNQYHGLLFLHVASSGEAVVASVLEAGPAPASDLLNPAWNPLANFMFVVAISLCPPDGAGTMCLHLGSQ